MKRSEAMFYMEDVDGSEWAIVASAVAAVSIADPRKRKSGPRAAGFDFGQEPGDLTS